MTTTNNDTVTGGKAGWSNTEIYILGGVFMPLFGALAVFATRNLIAERRSRNRGHLMVVQVLVVVVGIARVLHFLLGAYHSNTFLARYTVVHSLLVEVVYSIPTGALLGAFCLELAVFVQVGWAVKLQIKKLVKYTKTIQHYAYVGFVVSISTEVLADILIYALPDMDRIQTVLLEVTEVLVTSFILAVLGSTLLTVERVVSQRQCLPSARWNENPADDHDIHAQTSESMATPTAKSQVSRLWHVRISTALGALPMRARVTCVAVGVGCVVELCLSLLEIIDLDVEVGNAVYQATEVASRFFEVVVGAMISQSLSVLTTAASSSDSDNKNKGNPRAAGGAQPDENDDSSNSAAPPHEHSVDNL